jgi:hypothetical protein
MPTELQACEIIPDQRTHLAPSSELLVVIQTCRPEDLTHLRPDFTAADDEEHC